MKTSRIGRILMWLPALILCWLFWDSPVLWPVRIYAVFLHELGHALGALVTGGNVGQIRLFCNEGGDCTTLGGIPIVVFSSGYLGNLALGSVLLYLACRPRAQRIVTIALGVLTVLAAVFLVRNGYGIAACSLIGGALLLCGWKAPRWANAGVARVFGFINVLYPLWDIRSDVLQRPEIGSDARMLAEMLIGSWWPSALTVATIAVGICWMVIGLLMAAWVLSASNPMGNSDTKA